jgi:WD40 repeat protein
MNYLKPILYIFVSNVIYRLPYVLCFFFYFSCNLFFNIFSLLYNNFIFCCIHTLELICTSIFNKYINIDMILLSNNCILIYVMCVCILNVGNCSNTFNGHTNYIRSVIQLSDDRIISGGDDNVIKIWNLEGN